MRKTSTMVGNEKTQKIPKLGCTTLGPFQSSRGIAKRVAKKVGGRKTMVMIAMVFIE